MFTSKEVKQTDFLNQAKSARQERQEQKQKENAAIKIQALLRGVHVRTKFKQEIRHELQTLLDIPESHAIDYKPKLHSAVDVFKAVQKFLLIIHENDDQQTFEYLCKYLLHSMDTDHLKLCYVSLAFSKQDVFAWLRQLKIILWQCCVFLKKLKPESPNELRAITTYLHMLLTFTSTSTWKILKGKTGEAFRAGLNQVCSNLMGHLNAKGLYPVFQYLLTRGLARSKPCFKCATLSAIITVALRPLIASDFSINMMTVFILHTLSVPGLIYHISMLAPDILSTLTTHRIFSKCLDLLGNDQNTRIVFNTLEGNYSLCLLANLIQLGSVEVQGLVENRDKFVQVVIKLLERCEIYVQNKKSNLTHWHPVLGWFSQKTDTSLHDAMPYVMQQIQLLWSKKLVGFMFQDLFLYTDTHKDSSAESSKQQTGVKSFWKKVSSKNSKSSSGKLKLDSPVVRYTCSACELYQTSMKTLSQMKMNILAGLSYNDVLLPSLWVILSDLGPTFGLKTFLETISSNPAKDSHPIFKLLTLFCDTASHLLVILDDVELYQQQQPFTLNHLIVTSSCLNQFLSKTVWHGLIDPISASSNSLFTSLHTLLLILYERDCRRPYCPESHWLIKDLKSSTFLQELERGRRSAQFLIQKMPHIIPHRDRVVLFRKEIMKEKESLGLTDSASMMSSPLSTLITVYRSRLLEDGYRQLSLLPPKSLKGLIRVRFVNEQGLDEAGIDQDGVFKEFLEETIAKVFDPSLNLFKMTSEQQLYPSPISYLQENHLALFEFVGRMLGKAVYEGIVVDVPFAPFFLTQMLGNRQSATYSYMDELPSLDPELYKSLTYIKHYEDDVSDLDLTFSLDEDVLGQLVNHELIPGGKAVTVTNENKISYVHRMAIFRMHTQIKQQATAFIGGFKSIINTDWLTMFSSPELQKLISGDNIDLDLEDLKRHTQYYGGFYGGHKVVAWLWDVLQKDFTRKERSLFLKFVTSCSKPPLLGFANLEPPFSIRCVDVSDDQDTGDTVGSVIKGFFRLNKKDPVGRLPTSSTCFNLLKLPNYQKRSTLRDKLRYAITSNTGFELS